MGVSIAHITFVDLVVQSSGKSHEKAFSSLTDARRIRFGQAAEGWRSTKRTIATASGAALSRGLNGIIPQRTYDSTGAGFGRRAGVSMHSEKIEAIKLLMLSSTPFRPGAELHELVSGKFSQGTFFRGCGSSLEGREKLVDIIDGEVIDIVVVDKNGVNGTEFLSRDGQVIIRFHVRYQVVVKLVLDGGGVTILFSRKGFGSECKLEAA
jgi:hypothetical protein